MLKEEIIYKYQQQYNKIPNVKRHLYSIYTQDGLRGSAELNMALIEYFYSGLPFYNDDLREKALQINNGFFIGNSQRYLALTNEELMLYHGTNYNLHEPKSDFTTYAFFSTTISPEIAETYGKIIYKIKIPVGYPIINLYDQSNMQILLPIGTKIKNIAMESIKNNKITYSCEIDKTNIENIITTLSQLLKPKIEPINININIKTELKDISLFNSVKESIKYKASSTIYSCYFNNQGYGKIQKQQSPDNYIIKDILKKKDYTKCFKNEDYICRRIMNEILASLVYKSYGLETLDYDLIYNNQYPKKPKYMLGSKKINIDYQRYSTDQTKSALLLKGFIVDCILSNWDAYNNNNIGFLCDTDEVIRTDVGGALGYRGIGDFKLSFFNNLEPKEHITFIRENPNIRKLLQKIIPQTFEFMYELLNKKTDIQAIKADPKIAMFMPYYGDFIDKILDTVNNRHNYYVSNQKNVIKQIIDTLKELGITQAGGSKQFIIYQGKVRKVYTTNKMRYIILNKTKVDLKEIKGKYKYQNQSGGVCNEPIILQEKCPIFENVPGNDLDLTGTSENLEKLLENLKPKSNSNSKA